MKRETIRKKISSLTAKFAALLLAALGSAGSAWGATMQVTTQADLNTAVANAAAGDMVQVTTAGTYTLPTVPNNITIEGTVEGVAFNYPSAGQVASVPNGAKFKNVAFSFGDNHYTGFQHAGKIEMENCTLNGYFSTYASMTFVKCTFSQTIKQYHMWVYGTGGATVIYDDCTFNGQGKFLHLYQDNDIGKQTVIVRNCKFINNATEVGKAAINVKESCPSKNLILKYDLIIDNCTVEGPFPDHTTPDDTATFFDGGLYMLDSRLADPAATQVTITIDGKKVYPEPEAVTTVEVTGTTGANEAGTSANYTFVPKTTKGDDVTVGTAQTVAVSVATGDAADTTLAKFDMSDVLAAAVEKAGADAGNMTSVELLVKKSTPTATANSISYEVHPEAVVTVSKTGEADSTSTVELSNANLAANATFTFDLDVSSLNLAAGDQVKVTHSWAAYTDAAGASVAAGSETTLATVSNNKVSITTTHFSTWTLEGITIDPGTVAVVFAEDGTSTQHATLAAALTAAYDLSGDVAVQLVANTTGYAAICQKAGQNLTVNGGGNTLTGQLIVFGLSSYGDSTRTETLTIKNFSFTGASNKSDFYSDTDAFVYFTDSTSHYQRRYIVHNNCD